MQGDELDARAGRLRLKELAEVTAGPSGSLLNNLNDGPDGVPVLSPQNLSDDHHNVEERELRRVPWADCRKLGRFALQEGDLVIVRQGSIGRLALMEAKHSQWLYGSSCLRIRPWHGLVLPKYLAYYLSHPSVRRNLLERALPGTVPSLNTQILNELPIFVPSSERQQQIVRTMTDVDGEIAVQRAIVERLKNLRPAILDELIRKSDNHVSHNG